MIFLSLELKLVRSIYHVVIADPISNLIGDFYRKRIDKQKGCFYSIKWTITIYFETNKKIMTPLFISSR